MTPEDAKRELNYILDRQKNGESPEETHIDADDILCELLSYLGYDDVVNLYQQVDKWFA
jgi:hypothetical protein